LIEHQSNASAQESESRECRSCYGGGWVLLGASYDSSEGELVQGEAPCPICGGSGSVYLYGSR
jgi:hypothetical protein